MSFYRFFLIKIPSHINLKISRAKKTPKKESHKFYFFNKKFGLIVHLCGIFFDWFLLFLLKRFFVFKNKYSKFR